MVRSGILAGPRRFGAALLMLAAIIPPDAAGGPRIADIRVEGRLPFREARALRRAGIEPDDAFDPGVAQAAAERLMQACRVRDYPLATVHWQADPLEDGQAFRLLFRVQPGPRGRLREVRFEGLQALSASDLASVLRVRPREGLLRRLAGRRPLRVEQLAGDREALLWRYRQDGRMAAEIGDPVVEWLEAKKGFRVTWPVIREGPVYRIGAVRVEGDDRWSVSSLAETWGLGPGESLRPERLQGLGSRIRSLYEAEGHAFASVSVEPAWRDDDARLDLDITVHPGSVQCLRAVRIEGNTRTHEAVLLRELPLRPGDRFDPQAILAGRRNIEALGLFSDVDMQYQGGPDAPVFDLSIAVQEKRTGRVETGFEYGTVEKGAFLLRVTERNLALRPPFRGRGLQAELGATAGSEIVRLDAGLLNPRLRNSLWNLGVQAAYEDNAYISQAYDQSSLGAQVTAGHPLGRFHRYAFGFGWTRFEVTYEDPERFGPLPGMASDVNLTSVLGTWLSERVDHPLWPTRGCRFRADVRLSSARLGGDTDTVEIDARGAAYLPLRSHVLALRAGAGSATPYGDAEETPLALRRHLGGIDTLRGFAYRTVSPLDENGVPIGGESDYWASLEYIAPLFARLHLALYAEAGDVSPDALRFPGTGPVTSWGTGFLIQADNFPVRFDLAFPLRTAPGDRLNQPGEVRFSFSAGTRW